MTVDDGTGRVDLTEVDPDRITHGWFHLCPIGNRPRLLTEAHECQCGRTSADDWRMNV
jgi:hypothetical protein